MKGNKTRLCRVVAGVAGSLLALVLLWFVLQGPFAHRHAPFTPDYPQVDLSPILAQETLRPEDYQTLFLQTGLGPGAVDDLLALGGPGRQQIMDTQAAFFTPPAEATCSPLGVTTREHRYLDENGGFFCAVDLAPLREGDVIVSLSTHTAGWTHGHAGLVLEPEGRIPVTLESVVLGSPSGQMNGNHWRSYTTMAVLRPKADAETRSKVVELAREHLDGIPYSLVSGVFGDKFQTLNGPHSAHCGYLPWYAWAAVGIDLDSDGGRIVAPEDLLGSNKVEVVQLYGIDPAGFDIGVYQ